VEQGRVMYGGEYQLRRTSASLWAPSRPTPEIWRRGISRSSVWRHEYRTVVVSSLTCDC